MHLYRLHVAGRRTCRAKTTRVLAVKTRCWPSQFSAMSSWAEEWAALVRDRAARSCAQRARGRRSSRSRRPAAVERCRLVLARRTAGATTRTGRAQRCDQIEDPIDWRGISAPRTARSGLRLLIAACVVGLASPSTRSPRRRRPTPTPARRRGRQGRRSKSGLASFRFLPWRWERSAQWTGAGALVGLVAAFVVPLRSTPDLASSPPSEEYTVFS